MPTRRLISLLAMVVLLSTSGFAAKVKLVNGDPPGEGFNDPTPAAPVGGNKGKTLGEQRRLAFQYAANIWGANLPDSGDLQIRVYAGFSPLFCDEDGAVLGGASVIVVARDFPGATFPATWYPIALANRLAGSDLVAGPKILPGVFLTSFPPYFADDIFAVFNSSFGSTNPDGTPCFTGGGWYYGLDTDTPPNQVNLVETILHELAHGLGSSTFVSLSSGREFRGLDDIYERNLQDNDTGLVWNVMTDAQRFASARNYRDVVWTGPNVTAAVPSVLQMGTPRLTVNSPAGIAGDYDVGPSAFGPALTALGVTGNVVLALDPAVPGSPSPTDGCSPPFTNAAAVAGNIALIDAGVVGTCVYAEKVKNAQNAGAIAVLIANDEPGPLLGLFAADAEPTIVIPSLNISLADGNLIKANLGLGVNVTLRLDLAMHLGADPAGRALIYTPSPAEFGSSVSHWDTIATPNLLMEPFIFVGPGGTHNLQSPHDLTLELLRDIGW